MRDSGVEVRHPRKDRAYNVCRQKTESSGYIFKRGPEVAHAVDHFSGKWGKASGRRNLV